MVIGFAFALGLLWGVVYMIKVICETYFNNDYSISKKITIFLVNVVLIFVCIFGGITIGLSAGIIATYVIFFGIITNIILIMTVHPDEKEPPINKNKEKNGTIEWEDKE